MKKSSWHLFSVASLLLTSGCVSTITSKRSTGASNERGHLYSLPQPFLKVAISPTGALTKEVFYLPDPSRTYTVSAQSFLASHEFKPTFATEGGLNEVSYKLNSVAVPEALIKAVGTLFSGAIKQGEKEQEAEVKTEGEKAVAVKTSHTAYASKLEGAEKAVIEAKAAEKAADKAVRDATVARDYAKEDLEEIQAAKSSASGDDLKSLQAQEKAARRKLDEAERTLQDKMEDRDAAHAATLAVIEELGEVESDRPAGFDFGTNSFDGKKRSKPRIDIVKVAGPSYFRIDDLGKQGVRLVPVNFYDLPVSLKFHPVNGSLYQRDFDTWKRKEGDMEPNVEPKPLPKWSPLGGSTDTQGVTEYPVPPASAPLSFEVSCNIDFSEVSSTAELVDLHTGAVVENGVASIAKTAEKAVTILLKSGLKKGVTHVVRMQVKYKEGQNFATVPLLIRLK